MRPLGSTKYVKKQLFRDDIIKLVLQLGLVIFAFVNIYWVESMDKMSQNFILRLWGLS